MPRANLLHSCNGAAGFVLDGRSRRAATVHFSVLVCFVVTFLGFPRTTIYAIRHRFPLHTCAHWQTLILMELSMRNERDEANGASAPCKSILDGVDQMWAELLNVANLRHITALQKLSSFDGPLPIDAIYRRISGNYRASGATANKDRSSQNWRWLSLQKEIAARNSSDEVRVERAIVNACDRLGRTDWANQVPVASGLRRRGETIESIGALGFPSSGCGIIRYG